MYKTNTEIRQFLIKEVEKTNDIGFAMFSDSVADLYIKLRLQDIQAIKEMVEGMPFHHTENGGVYIDRDNFLVKLYELMK